jgi:hypothetical protein
VFAEDRITERQFAHMFGQVPFVPMTIIKNIRSPTEIENKPKCLKSLVEGYGIGDLDMVIQVDYDDVVEVPVDKGSI